MNDQANTGGAAFPRPFSEDADHDAVALAQAGMTLRDYFAARALIALMSSDPWVRGMNSHAAHEDSQFKTALAVHSWQMADAMLAARGQGGAA